MIGLINAYYFDDSQEYQKTYSDIYLNFMNSVFPNEKIKMYNVAFGEWPLSPNECQGWVISGSSKAAYDGQPWISKLGEFVRTCDQKNIKLIGICFGHQLIAQALGGKVQKHSGGWGVGVQDFKIVNPTRWMQPSTQKCSLLFSHQDQVVKLPPNAVHIAQSDFCQYQMFSIGEHIFAMQGHPEFSVEFAEARMNTRRSLLGEDLYKQAMATLKNKTASELVRQWMFNFMSKKQNS